jgi:Mg2+ and Co2+ transporter CorA
MNTIAVLTLLYLPATLVCSFFGTNFFTLEVKDDGRQVFLVSERCWIYFLSTLLLTALTVFIWLKWLRRSAHDQAQQSLP